MGLVLTKRWPWWAAMALIVAVASACGADDPDEVSVNAVAGDTSAPVDLSALDALEAPDTGRGPGVDLFRTGVEPVGATHHVVACDGDEMEALAEGVARVDSDGRHTLCLARTETPSADQAAVIAVISDSPVSEEDLAALSLWDLLDQGHTAVLAEKGYRPADGVGSSDEGTGGEDDGIETVEVVDQHVLVDVGGRSVAIARTPTELSSATWVEPVDGGWFLSAFSVGEPSKLARFLGELEGGEVTLPEA
jgi:hypothetical protein